MQSQWHRGGKWKYTTKAREEEGQEEEEEKEEEDVHNEGGGVGKVGGHRLQLVLHESRTNRARGTHKSRDKCASRMTNSHKGNS